MTDLIPDPIDHTKGAIAADGRFCGPVSLVTVADPEAPTLAELQVGTFVGYLTDANFDDTEEAR